MPKAPSLSCPPVQPVRAATFNARKDGTFRMAKQMRKVYGGVDTHGRTHHAAAIDGTGRVLGDREFAATPAGYRKLISWIGQLGDVAKVGIEGTGSYGAGLARAMAEANIQIVEVDRPDRRARRRKGKSDPLDALAAARAALSGEAAGIPKTRSGPVEAIRALRVARRGAIKARTAAFNQLHEVIVSAPAGLRAALAELRGQQLVDRCAAFRIDDVRIDDPATATKAALRAIARRIIALQDEIQAADRRLAPLTTAVAPRTAAVFGVGAEVAGRCWSPRETFPNGFAARPRSRICVPWNRFRRVADGPIDTDSTAAETAPPTPRSIWSS
ncbi:transposase [Rhodococcus opacus]|nr:transposase [Rhodococcus opacus]